MAPEANGKSNSNGEPQKRLACNRCHAQKLRCPRDEAGGDCARCVKAGAQCIYSPPLPMGRPALENGEGRKRRRKPTPTTTEPAPASIPASAPAGVLTPVSMAGPQISPSGNDSPGIEQPSNAFSRSSTIATDLSSFGDFVGDWQNNGIIEQNRGRMRSDSEVLVDSALGLNDGDPMALDGDGNLFINYSPTLANMARAADYPTNLELDPALDNEFSRHLSAATNSYEGSQSGSLSAHSHSFEDLRVGSGVAPHAYLHPGNQRPLEDSSGLQGFPSQFLRNRGRFQKTSHRLSTNSVFSGPDSLHAHGKSSQPRRNTQDSTTSRPVITSDPVEECIMQLSEFNLTLYRRSKHRQELAAAFSAKRSPRGGVPPIEAHTAGADETFQASQTFIEILHRLLRRCKACKGEATSGLNSAYNSPSNESHGFSTNSSPFTFRSSVSYSHSNSPEPSSDPTSAPRSTRRSNPSTHSSYSPKRDHSTEFHKRLDSPTIFLVLTCYLRLLEEFYLLLGIIQVHLQRIIQNFGSEGSEYVEGERTSTQPNLPGLCFGSFSLSSSSQMQIVLLVQGIVHLLDRAKKAICLIAEPAARDLNGIGRDVDLGADDMDPSESVSDRSDCSTGTASGQGLDGEIRCIAELALLDVVNQQHHARITVKSVKKLLHESSAF